LASAIGASQRSAFDGTGQLRVVDAQLARQFQGLGHILDQMSVWALTASFIRLPWPTSPCYTSCG